MNRQSILYKILKKCEMPPSGSHMWHLFSIFYNLFMVCLGKRLLSEYVKHNNTDSFLLVPVFSNGDMLMLYRSIKLLEENNHIQSPTIMHVNYLVHAVSSLGFVNTISLPAWKIIPMCKALLFYSDIYKNVYNTLPWHIFRIKDVKDPSLITPISNKISDITIRELFPDVCMKDRSVILSPYEQSYINEGEEKLPSIFWEILAKELKKMGYWVFTNCDGVNELPVQGTQRLFPDLKDISGAVDYAGCCICVRSGFVDWCMGSKKASLLVLYPSITFYNRFNVRLVWNREDVHELIYNTTSKTLQNLTDEILSILEQR